MSGQRESKPIPPEKMARIAEKGLKAVRLGAAEKEYLAGEGLEEYYALRDSLKEPAPSLSSGEVDDVMLRFFPADESPERSALVCRIREKALELVENCAGWQQGSPAFATRGPSEEGRVRLCKEAGKLTVHLEIVRRGERLVDVNVRLTDTSGRDTSSFEVELLKDTRSLETVGSAGGATASLSRIAVGDYRMRISDRKGEITSLSIRLEK